MSVEIYTKRLPILLRSSLRKELGRNEEPSASIIDSQSVKSIEMSRDIAGFDGGKKN